MSDDLKLLDELEAKHRLAKDASRDGELPNWSDVGFSGDGYEPDVAEYMAAALNALPLLIRLARRGLAAKEEMQNIVNAKPETWAYPDDFREWAKNRARHALGLLDEKEGA